MNKADVIYIKPSYCYEGQNAFISIGGEATAVTVLIAAGDMARVYNPDFEIDRFVHLHEMRIIKILSPSEQLKKLGWSILKSKSSKKIWIRKLEWHEPLSTIVKPVTLEEACRISGIKLD